MNVMVTGGAGYIGSVVTEVLRAEGHRVVVFDDLRKGHRLAVPEDVPLVEGDLLETETVSNALREHRVDGVVHMAAHSLVGESVVDPAKYYRNNVVGGLSLLDAMLRNDVRLLVFSSTAAVYGEPGKQPIEEGDPTRPTNPYGETKLAFERALHWYGQACPLRYASLRYFNAAGATRRNGELHDPESHLIPLLLRAAMGDGEVTVFGEDYETRDGTCVRDYIHVEDLARAHVLALEAIAAPDAQSRIYNLGCGGDGYTVREVLEAARRVTGREIPVRLGARRAGDPAVLVASSAKIHEELGWTPRMQNLEEIVSSAWRWLRAMREAREAGSQWPAS